MRVLEGHTGSESKVGREPERGRERAKRNRGGFSFSRPRGTKDGCAAVSAVAIATPLHSWSVFGREVACALVRSPS